MNTLARWRLVLGRFADKQLTAPLSDHEKRMEAALDFLYAREYKGRGVRDRQQAGTLDPSQLNVPSWLGEVRELFPREVVEGLLDINRGISSLRLLKILCTLVARRLRELDDKIIGWYMLAGGSGSWSAAHGTGPVVG